MKKPLWLVFALLISPAADASKPSEESLQKLAQHPMWLELLHYERSFLGSLRSAIHSPAFFLSPIGQTNALAELRATLHDLEKPPTTDLDQHAYCRFPARAQWLKAQLGTAASIYTHPCPTLDEWTKDQSIDSVSVIFATGFLGNPASYYGHTLLKLNSATDADLVSPTKLLDVSVNYGAILEGRTDPLSYIAKGIFGGYDGGFSHIRYYFHNHNYGEAELRDLWEYPLELSPEDARFIVNHAWEVLGMRYTYYFFRRNCAFRMAELLEMATEVEAIPANRPWTIPQSVIQHLDTDKRANFNTEAIRYYPSRQSRLYHRFRQLKAHEKMLLTTAIADADWFNSVEFESLPLDSQHAIIDTTLDYYQFAIRSKVDDADVLERRYREALAKRYQLPPGRGTFDIPAPSSPHSSRAPGWIQASLGYNGSHGPLTQLRIRPAYYDALDGTSGHVPNASLSMGDMTIRMTKDNFSLSRLTLFSIENLNPGVTGLPGDDGSMWSLGAGFHSLRLDCADCLVARLHGDIGTATRFSDQLVTAFHIGGALQDSRMGYGNGLMQVGGRAIYRHAEWSGRASYKLGIPVDGDRPAFSMIELEARRSLSVNSDIRLLLEQNGGRQFSIGLGLYW
ncbi:Lnb N-terminal periplasmic domain-containing protein [Halopseudomonas xiamenensis]|uniref:Lnb N-terminal periplasmic domain-containing protein n=1 Tax=Halopseudomonas xiamenensis TaxID=157792 RepID=UPI001629FDFB|nr:DUF4105 domain-containing protein [Halopseudomonas xiamenensis]